MGWDQQGHSQEGRREAGPTESTQSAAAALLPALLTLFSPPLYVQSLLSAQPRAGQEAAVQTEAAPPGNALRIMVGASVYLTLTRYPYPLP